MATPEIALIALVIAGFTLAPAEPPKPAANLIPETSTEAVAIASPAGGEKPIAATRLGQWLESDSFTPPPELARCIAYNISRKMPHLNVRQRSDATADDRILLVLSEPGQGAFGVIRVTADDSGSKLTTWLAARELPAAPDAMAKRLIAGC